jgi:hypothetical protein
VQLGVATGFLPAIVGTAWALRQVVRPARAESGVFAVVALGLFLGFVLLTTSHGSVSEERYIAPFAALPVVAFGVAVLRREAWPLGTLIVGIGFALAIDSLGPFARIYPGAVDYLNQPARLFHQELLMGRASTVLPGSDTTVLTIAMVLMVLAAVAVAVLTAPWAAGRIRGLARRPAVVALAAVVPVLVLAGAGAVWAKTTFENQQFAKRGVSDLAWVDRATGGLQARSRTFLWAYAPPGAEGAADFESSGLLLYNKGTCCTIWGRNVPPPARRRAGALPGPGVRYLLRPVGYVPLVFRSRPVERRVVGPVEFRLDRLLDRGWPALRVVGAEADGTVPSRSPVALDATRFAGRGRCVDAPLIAPRR